MNFQHWEAYRTIGEQSCLDQSSDEVNAQVYQSGKAKICCRKNKAKAFSGLKNSHCMSMSQLHSAFCHPYPKVRPEEANLV